MAEPKRDRLLRFPACGGGTWAEPVQRDTTTSAVVAGESDAITRSPGSLGPSDVADLLDVVGPSDVAGPSDGVGSSDAAGSVRGSGGMADSSEVWGCGVECPGVWAAGWSFPGCGSGIAAISSRARTRLVPPREHLSVPNGKRTVPAGNRRRSAYPWAS
ncbi:hypothetical protein GCM10027280_47260 [Micromonospora polyrhachis]